MTLEEYKRERKRESKYDGERESEKNMKTQRVRSDVSTKGVGG